jgi:hypothetical protein
MKNLSLLMVVAVSLVTLGFGQTPTPNVDQASIKGCLAGTENNYNVAQDGTTQTFRITSSTVDLKPHLGHDVEIIGQTANVAPSSGPADNTVIVTGVNTISDHCTTATARAPAAADPAPTATASTTAVADPAPAATASTPVVADPAPTATVSTPVAAPTPAAPASEPMTASAPAPESAGRMPDTASPLPLLALLGFGLLAMGLMSRRLWAKQR